MSNSKKGFQNFISSIINNKERNKKAKSREDDDNELAKGQ
jgi:hypothetical protein